MYLKRFWVFLFVINSILGMIAFAGLGIYSARLYAKAMEKLEMNRLHTAAELFAGQVLPLFDHDDYGKMGEICETELARTQIRFTIIDQDGNVIADSYGKPGGMENHQDRKEVIDARKYGTGRDKRDSVTRREPFFYAALSCSEKEGWVIRASAPISSINKGVKEIRQTTFLAMCLLILLWLAANALIALRLSRPLKRICNSVDALARGEFDLKIPEEGPTELAQIAKHLNKMAAHLKTRFQLIEENRIRQETVLNSMNDAVIAIDNDGRLIEANPVGCSILGEVLDKCSGKTLPELRRDPAFLTFADNAQKSITAFTKEIRFSPPDNRIFLIQGTPLYNLNQKRIGTLLVLHDMTLVNKLEKLRQNFVANVSHELRTPIAAMKAAVETLLDGAKDDQNAATEFLTVAKRHAERLEAIVNDLLLITRLERGEEEKVSLKRSSVSHVIENAIASCTSLAENHNVKIHAAVDHSLEAEIEERLLEQAVVNLIDNAIKYSHNNGDIFISAKQENEEIMIQVRDTGIGISQEHLPRLFERFYRVDKARSRARGGTGLGLSIVKHIAKLHGGEAEVSSKLNKGSTFTIRFPNKAHAKNDD